jgi:hypothetical protein
MSDMTDEDRRAVFRVTAEADTPVNLSGSGSSAELILIQSVDHSQKAEPLATKSAASTSDAISGSTVITDSSYNQLYAEFSMADLERVRSASPKREFLVIVMGQHSKTFQVKERYFRKMGD